MTQRRQRPRHFVLVALTALTAALLLAAPAMGNALRPGDNARIGFSSFAHYPDEIERVIDGTSNRCGDEDNWDDGIFYDLIDFSRCGEELETIGPDSSNRTRETDNTRLDGKFSWNNSAPGSGWAFESNRNCDDESNEAYVVFLDETGLCLQDIYKVDTNGDNPVALTNHPARDVHPTISPNGQMMAFESGRPLYEALFSNNNLGRLGKGDGGVLQVRGIFTTNAINGETAGPADPFAAVNEADVPENELWIYADMTPVWSPGGQTIAFTRFLIKLQSLELPPIGFADAVKQALGPDGSVKLDGLRGLLTERASVLGSVSVSMQTWTAPADGSAAATPLGGPNECV